MNWMPPLLLLVAAFLGVFLEVTLDWPRAWVGCQPSLLPPLIVYAALNSNLTTVTLLALAGGLWTDALSANPLGASVLPLYALGFALYRWRDLLLRDLAYARLVFGFLAALFFPVATLLILLTLGEPPLLGPITLWHLLVAAITGALLTPPCFWILERVHTLLLYPPVAPLAFRPDREIKRGRH